MKNKGGRGTFLGLLLVVILGSNSGAEPEKPKDEEKTMAMRWFQTAEHLPLFTKTGAPKDEKDYHQWAWTALMHYSLIDGATGNPMFLSLRTPDDLRNQISFGAQGRKLLLRPRMQKPNRSVAPKPGVDDGKNKDPKAVEEILGIPSGPGGLITDQNGRIVYYSTHLNDTYFDFAKKFYGVRKYTDAPENEEFPRGSTVLKASWIVLSNAEADAAKKSPCKIKEEGDPPKGCDLNPKEYFSTEATVELLVNDADGRAVPSGATAKKTVALIGLHVASHVRGHPDLVWTTFEHNTNAPNLPPGSDPEEVVSDGKFRFYKPGTQACDCNRLDKNGLPVKISVVNEATQICEPYTPIYRRFKFGGADEKNRTEIIKANREFKDAIIESATAENVPDLCRVFANYNLIGTVWKSKKEDAGRKPAAKDSKQKLAAVVLEIKGSTSLANATMETYQQVKGQNCFTCHNHSAGYSPKGEEIYPRKRINLSHIILRPFLEE